VLYIYEFLYQLQSSNRMDEYLGMAFVGCKSCAAATCFMLLLYILYYIQYGRPVTLCTYTYTYINMYILYRYRGVNTKYILKSSSQQMRSQRDAEVCVHNIIKYSTSGRPSYTVLYIYIYIMYLRHYTRV